MLMPVHRQALFCAPCTRLTLTKFMDLITGKWIGSYIYGDSYVDELKGKKILFTLELVSDGELITGTCTDDETKDLFLEPSKIEGSFENDVVLFYKSYPTAKGLVGASLLIAQEYNFSSIQYTGVIKKNFLSRKRFMQGTWEVNGSFLDDEGVANYYVLDGTWKVEKV